MIAQIDFVNWSPSSPGHPNRPGVQGLQALTQRGAGTIGWRHWWAELFRPRIYPLAYSQLGSLSFSKFPLGEP